MKLGSPSPQRVAVLFVAFAYWVCILGSVHVTQAQTQATTHPDEVRALNSVFQHWGLQANQDQWNISGEPCSGAAIDSTIFDNSAYNPFIKCDCSYNNGTLCHIIELKVFSLDVLGVIPDELWTLTFLTNLDLRQNVLTGPLSASIQNLSALKYLSVGTNALSGELPKELGTLTDLRSLSVAANNFTGTLPFELGSLTKLQQLYITELGITGEIPSSFSNLRNLETIWAYDTALTGRIPDFIGNWSKLTSMRFQGNAFEGQIPSSFSNLTTLIELRISGLTNGSSSLEFIRNLKSLSVLELRNNNISDSLPSNIGELQSLKHLDLSFNNIHGRIPDSLFSLSSLTHLFLGSNLLNGTLPAQKSTSLLNIDVSYNNLIGNLPSWVNEQNLQLNLVANNLTIDNSDNRRFGLKCLQRNFPCNRGSGIYYNFSINCGGPEVISSNDIVYESDNATVGPASYFVTDTGRWGVSNVGYFTASKNPKYTSFSQSQFTNTLDTQLFQTARISASSLRYYGLDLENGNYSVTLQFAELTMVEAGWKSLGRRVFDIYIQGNLVFKDFDIKKEADGVLKKAIQREFKAQVSENYLEIHLFWAAKGTYSIPDLGTYGPTISAISATPDFVPTVSNNPPTNSKKNRAGLIVGIVVGIGLVSLILVLSTFWIVRSRKMPSNNDDKVLLEIATRPYTFSYVELKTATEDFNPANKLGEGRFGPVYMGKLDDGRVIAVKKLSVASHQRNSQFVAEIVAISAVQHHNLVKLYGCCIEGSERLIVYEYLENKTLDLALFGESSLNFNWSMRFDICSGMAKGLSYLHEESRLQIIHRNVKASNILLDSELNPKISDFDLAKLYDEKKTHINTHVTRKIGYLAPEYAIQGHPTEKTDVFAFGVLTLEIISGRPNSYSSCNENQIYLLEWAWNLHENNSEVELVDLRLTNFNEEEVKRMIRVALLCTQTMPSSRPPMSRVVAMLCGDAEVNKVTTKPGYLT